MRASSLLGLGSLGLATIGAVWAARRAAMPPRAVHQSESEEAFLQARTRVVVLGAGFGGMSATLAMDDLLRDQKDLSILVIDRDNSSLFNPLLWTVADGRASPNDVVVPIRTFQWGRRFHVLQAQVQGIDLAKQEVQTNAGPRPFDYLIIALGSVTEFPPVPGVERALPFRTSGDALNLRDQLIDAIEAAHRATSEADRAAWLTFVVVGGGDTGVELAGAVHGYLAAGLLREYPWLAQDEGHRAFRVVLVGRAPHLVPMAGMSEGEETRRILEQEGIEVRTGTGVTEVRPGVVVTNRGEIPAHTVFWAAGIAPAPVLRGLPVQHAKGGVLVVDDHLRLPDHPEVYVVGDAAWIMDAEGRSVPPTAQAAEHAGAYVGRAIAATIRGNPLPEPFRFRPLGHLALLGPGQAMLTVGPFRLANLTIGPFRRSGFFAWLLWHLYYLYRIPTLKRRVDLVTSWLLALIFGREVAELRVKPIGDYPSTVPAKPAEDRSPTTAP